MGHETIKVLDILTESTFLKDKLFENTRYFRENMKAAGFSIPDSIHPIVPIMLGDAVLAQKASALLLKKGVYASAFFYPVVPLNKARIRTQISAIHEKKDLDYVIESFSSIRNILKF